MREPALEHVRGGRSDDAYLARVGELRAHVSALESSTDVGVSAERAVAWLRTIGATWSRADLPEEKADLVHAIYERITVAGERFASVRRTPAAYAHGLALSLPQVVMARPTGVGHGITAYEMPIEGRDEWLAAARRMA